MALKISEVRLALHNKIKLNSIEHRRYVSSANLLNSIRIVHTNVSPDTFPEYNF